MKKYNYIIAVLVSVFSVFGATITGKIVDRKTGEALAGAHVRLVGTASGDVTNLDGNFRIETTVLPVELIISHISYEAETLEIKDESPLRVSLSQGAIVGEDVIIAGKSSGSGTTAEGFSIGSSEIKARRDAGAVNLGDLILGVAGANIQVCCALDNRAELRLLGLPGAYTEINLDGIPEVGGLAANYRLYTYPAIGIERMNVSKGASSAKSQAKALGGQLDILTRNPAEGPAQGSVAAYYRSVGGNQLQGELAARAGGIGFTAAMDLAEGKAFDRDGDGWSEAPSVDRSFGRMRAFFGNEMKVFATLTGLYIGEERLGGMMDVTRDNFGREPYWVRSVNTKRYEGNALLSAPVLEGDLSISLTAAEVSLDQIAGTDYTIINEGGYVTKGIWTGFLAGTDLTTGIEFRHESIEDLSPENIGRLDGSSDRFSLLAEDIIYPTDALELKAGLRIDGNSSNKIKRQWAVFPRFSLNLHATEKLFFVLSLGSGGRFRPSVQELMEGYDHSVSVVVPPDLEGEKGFAASLGAEWRHLFGTNILALAGGASHSLINNRIVPISSEHGEHSAELTYINADGRTDISSMHAQCNLDLGGSIEFQIGGEFTRAKTSMHDLIVDLPFTPQWRGFGKAIWKDVFGVDGLKLWINSTAFGKQALPENSFGIAESEPLLIGDLTATYRFGPMSVTTGFWNIFDAVQSISPIQGTADPFATGVSTELVYGPLVGRTFVASIVYHFGKAKDVLIGAGYGGLVPKEQNSELDYDVKIDRIESINQPEPNYSEANVWLVDENGAHYTCPVMGNSGIVDEKTESIIVDGMKYYLCCPACNDEAKVRAALRGGFVVPGNIISVDNDEIRFLCPVMENEGTISETTPFSDYNGKRIYFCCPPCKPKFDTEPEKYLK